MERLKLSLICDRCHKETKITTGSFFNTEMICLDCENIEKHHPDYEEAKRIEHEEVVKGNYNFQGVGLPKDYFEFAENFIKNNSK